MIPAAALALGLNRYVVMDLRVNAYGIPGNGTIVVDRQSRRFVRRFNVGPASDQEGWDGVRAWRADATGTSRVQGNVGEKSEILQWSIALARAMGGTAHVARIRGATDRVVVSFERYTKHHSLSIPLRIVSRSQQNGQWTASVKSVETSPTMSASTFDPVEPTKRDFRLDGITQVPVAMNIGSPTLSVTIDGAELNVFFDTGGQNVITFEAAKRIGIPVEGRGVVSGGGGGMATIAYATVKTMRVGDATFFDQPFIVLPADSLPSIDGIICHEVLARLAARLDMAHGTLELAPDASAFGPAIAAARFSYFDRQPQMEGSLDSVTGAFSIDTGSSLTAQVQTPVVRAQHLIARFNATVTAQASDVGGRYPLYIVRARRLYLGPVLFEDPLVDLMTRESTSDNTSIVANVGDGILRRWVIVFDYRNHVIDFRPGGDPSGNLVHDHSGMTLAANGDQLIVAQVLGGTPAFESGLTEGERIVGINGSPVGAADLARVRLLQQQEPGTILRLVLADGTAHELTLRAYL
jgi:hypothetical protein